MGAGDDEDGDEEDDEESKKGLEGTFNSPLGSWIRR